MREFNYYSTLATNIYNRMNGEINTTIMANQLVIEKLYPSVAGRSIFMGVFINLVDLYNTCVKYGLTDEEMTGAVIFVVLHELSHCDQERDPLKAMKDQNYRLYIENSNNNNTISFINRNMKDIISMYGNFIIPPNILTLDSDNFKDPNAKFVQSKSFKDSLIYSLSGFCKIDFHEILSKMNQETIILKLNISDITKIELEMIRDGVVKICKSELIFLENIFANSKFVFNISLSTDEKGRLIVNIDGSDSSKLKVLNPNKKGV